MPIPPPPDPVDPRDRSGRIDVGALVGKYEIQERVGQGGMAVVYRAIDRSLGREVAIKVLHPHLSESAEARHRFSREAQAVARLKHENIVEIYDYSQAEATAPGVPTRDNFIVTEFIRGHTLKQVVSDRPIGFPEIGAMVVLQLARALAHAHGAGILHRDIKPENVMVRDDGVVKLMDFGISHMVDLERLTVTGQLLGSPAYMSPEHVEGRPIDYRTDVFAVGIVLYQLTVGKLPFDGRNPHEVLKRIAECQYADPQQANPQINNALAQVIRRALSRDPAARYQSVAEMAVALEGVLADAGLTSPVTELARYFRSPASYEIALRERLLDHMYRRGRELLATNRTAALAAFDRVLTLDPQHEGVLRVLASLERRRRWVSAAVGLAGLALVGTGAFTLRRILEPPEALPPSAPSYEDPHAALLVEQRRTRVVRDTLAAGHDGHAPALAGSDERDLDGRGPTPRAGEPPITGGTAATAAIAAIAGVVHVGLFPRTSEYRIGAGPWLTALDGSVDVPVGNAPQTISVRNDACCQSESRRLVAADAGSQKTIPLPFLPGQIIPHCATAGVTVRVEGRPVRLDERVPIPFGLTTQTSKPVEVEFMGDRVIKQTVQVTAAQETEVTCAP